jgi:threonine/homoserine/homoserine lactone efflux protein
MFYLSLLPQFIDPSKGHILGQSLVLGLTQISISISVNSMLALTAGSIAGFLTRHPGWLLAQRWIMGSVLGGLAVQMAVEARK